MSQSLIGNVIPARMEMIDEKVLNSSQSLIGNVIPGGIPCTKKIYSITSQSLIGNVIPYTMYGLNWFDIKNKVHVSIPHR